MKRRKNNHLAKGRKIFQIVGPLTHIFFTKIFDLVPAAMQYDMGKEKRGDFLTEFGRNLKKLRTEKNLSYRRMAQLCNVDYSDISKIEKGEVNIQIETAAELARGLGVHPKELFDFEFE